MKEGMNKRSSIEPLERRFLLAGTPAPKSISYDYVHVKGLDAQYESQAGGITTEVEVSALDITEIKNGVRTQDRFASVFVSADSPTFGAFVFASGFTDQFAMTTSLAGAHISFTVSTFNEVTFSPVTIAVDLTLAGVGPVTPTHDQSLTSGAFHESLDLERNAKVTAGSVVGGVVARDLASWSDNKVLDARTVDATWTPPSPATAGVRRAPLFSATFIASDSAGAISDWLKSNLG